MIQVQPSHKNPYSKTGNPQTQPHLVCSFLRLDLLLGRHLVLQVWSIIHLFIIISSISVFAIGSATLVCRVEFFGYIGLRIGLEILIDGFFIFVRGSAIRSRHCNVVIHVIVIIEGCREKSVRIVDQVILNFKVLCFEKLLER